MNDNLELPPLASPHGSGNPPAGSPDVWNEAHPCVEVLLSDAGAFRYACADVLQPLCLGAMMMAALVILQPLAGHFRGRILILLGLVGVSLLLSFLLFLAGSVLLHLFANRHYEIELTSDGVYRRSVRNQIFIPWRSVIAIVEVNGDVVFFTFAGVYFVFCEAFDSRHLSHDFAVLARKIQRNVFGPF